MRPDDVSRLPGDGETAAEVVRHEEELEVSRRHREVGRVRFRKVVEEQPFADVVNRGIEHADIEVVAPSEGDSGEIEELPDGSVSIPIFEEQIVVEKRLVVRERVLIRKRVEQRAEEVAADLRREVLEIDADPEAAHLVHVDEPPLPDA